MMSNNPQTVTPTKESWRVPYVRTSGFSHDPDLGTAFGLRPSVGAPLRRTTHSLVQEPPPDTEPTVFSWERGNIEYLPPAIMPYGSSDGQGSSKYTEK